MEIGWFLTEHTDFHGTPAVVGSLEYHAPDGQVASLALLQEFKANIGDAWRTTLHRLTSILDGSDSNESVRSIALLGETTGALHVALAQPGGGPEFDAEPITGYKPKAKDADVLPKIRFRVWIDKADVQWAKLDAESIDFLDMVFRLERTFKIKIPRGKIVENARGDLPEAEFEQKGIVTEKGMAQLRSYLSEIPAERFKTPMKVADIPRLFTPETFCKLVVHAQREAQPAA